MQLNQEKKDKECLQSELIRLKETVRKLYDALEAERKTGKTLNQNDCSLIQVKGIYSIYIRLLQSTNF